ncbi:MAG: cell division protein ZipA C-terminal FtsZ-binding domain-containing protein [Sulfuritalea sp.]|nr:cell division protein ZipA C-terminal FtsZ-binding domain-containing protein [Sulfuritalea sp.]
MSDLQLSLVGLGIALVAGVFAYNKWQERKHRKLAERVFRGDHPDVLLGRQQAAPEGSGAAGEERLEPGIQFAVQGDETESAAAVAGRETPPDLQATHETAEPPVELVDPVIDCVVRFESAEMIGGPYLWQAQHQAMGKLTKPLCWCGLNEHTGAWERLSANGVGDYRRLRVGLQLADRRGPLLDTELTIFLNGVQRLSDEFLAVADLPTRNEVLARAAEIDRFCAGVDIQIGVNLVSSGAPFAGTKLRGLTEASGMTLREDGMFHVGDEEGATLYTLSNLEAMPFAAEEMKTFTTHGITFTLDVPRVAGGPRTFDRMIALAKQFAGSLGGTLVDDNRAPLADTALDVIHDKIVEVEQRMAEQGLIAGGKQALRLFS